MGQGKSRTGRRLGEVLLILAILGVVGFIVARLVRSRAVEDPATFDVTRPGIRDALLSMPARPHDIADLLANPRSVRRHTTFTLNTNSHGLRGPEFDAQKPAGTFRVLCAGDCVAFGNGVEDDETYPARLGVALREAYPGRKIEVINAGIPGAVPSAIYERLEEQGVALDPDLVVFGPGADTVFLDEHTGAAPRRIWLSDEEYAATLTGYRALAEGALRLGRTHGFSVVLVTPTMNSFFLPDGALWSEELVRVGQEHGVPVVDTSALFLAVEGQEGLMLEPGEGTQRLVRYRGGEGKVLLEVPFDGAGNTRHVAPEIYTYLDDHRRVSTALSIDENHPNVRGQELIAGALRDVIVEQGLIDGEPAHR